jgi:hypothetical protein
MSQEVATGDIVFGAIILVGLLICALMVGRFISGIKNKRFARAWAPLMPLINGKASYDGGGAATSWLTGTYCGKQVQATMIPDRNLYTEQSGSRYNYFDVALLDIDGQRDWQISYKTAVLGMGHTGWHLVPEDTLFEARLQNANIMAVLTQLGNPTIEYSARGRRLRYSADVTPRWVPTPEKFQAALEILLQLATIHNEMNQKLT